MSGPNFDTKKICSNNLDYYLTLYKDTKNDTDPSNPQALLVKHELLNVAGKQPMLFLKIFFTRHSPPKMSFWLNIWVSITL
jgi:hypothetical protein